MCFNSLKPTNILSFVMFDKEKQKFFIFPKLLINTSLENRNCSGYICVHRRTISALNVCILYVRAAWAKHTVSSTGDKQQGAPSRPLTPHWSVSMVSTVWWTAEIRVRSEGCPPCSLPPCSMLTLITSSGLTHHPSHFFFQAEFVLPPLRLCCPSEENVATSLDKRSLCHISGN